jgi:23S rRNA-/tRNA-specific pseudouridylate synthase
MGGRAPYLMHRLDVDTSGLLLFGKVPQVVDPIMKQFRWGLRGEGGTAAGSE